MKIIFRYLKNYSSQPFNVDRLIVSAFLEINQLQVLQNRQLINYIISEEEIEEWEHLISFIEVIKTEIEAFDVEKLIELFEFVISPEDRIVNGAIYTPNYIRHYITTKAFELANDFDFNQIKIADIACGCGGFLYTAAKELNRLTGNSYQYIFSNNIFGLDLQQYSVDRTKLLLSLLSIVEGEDIEEFNFNIHQGDALTFLWRDVIIGHEGFSCILGNPPYVRYRNLDLETRVNVKRWEVGRTGLTDLYIPFFQIGIENLTEDGVLGYITMNSFFKSLNGRALRSYFANQNLRFIIEDFGAEQVFKARNTYVCICFIQNTQSEVLSYTETNERILTTEKKYDEISYTILDSKKGWNLKNNQKIDIIENTGQRFGDLYKTRHGIATLKNDIYIFKPVAEDDDFYYLQNGDKHPIEKEICRDIINSNKLSRGKNLSQLEEKIIFPYSINEKVDIIAEEELEYNYPKAYKYLKHKKEILATRDKGKAIDYNHWYAYGRTQSLEKMMHKLFFPKFSDITPSFLSNHNEDLMFYNGLALIGNNIEEVEIVRKIMESEVFWYYIKNTSKPYSSNYYSLNSTYINNFGVCELDESDKNFLLIETDKKLLKEFFEEKYKVISD